MFVVFFKKKKKNRYALALGVSLRGTANLYGDVMKAVGAGQRIFEVIDRCEQNEKAMQALAAAAGPVDAALQNPVLTGEIFFRNITFSYPGRPSVVVLNNLSLHIKPGQVVALCGESGSGKTTISHLLTLLYTPQQGEVLINGLPLNALNRRNIMNQIGVVSQGIICTRFWTIHISFVNVLFLYFFCLQLEPSSLCVCLCFFFFCFFSLNKKRNHHFNYSM